MDIISKLEGLARGKAFINDDFMLTNDIARELYHESAAKMPIIDYHCHLVPKMIADNYQFKDLTEVWLGGDHYKWRAMRGNGVPEEFITGSALNPGVCGKTYLAGAAVGVSLRCARLFDGRAQLTKCIGVEFGVGKSFVASKSATPYALG